MKVISKVCRNHGLTEFVLRGKKRYRCRKCAVDSVQKRRIKLKIQAIEYKGGKCQSCGYNKYNGALEFHHTNPSEKDFSIGSEGKTRSFEKIKVELDKCILLCSNCHKELHAGLIKV